MILSYFDGYPFTESEDLQETKEEYEFRKQLTKALGHYDIDFFKRLLRLETILEEKIQLYDAKLSELEAMNKGSTGQGINPEEQEPLKLKTITEFRAYYLFEFLKSIQERAGTKFLTPQEITHFLKNLIQKDYRISDKGNPRQKKKETVEKLLEMFPNDVFIDQRKRNTQQKILRLKKQK